MREQEGRRMLQKLTLPAPLLAGPGPGPADGNEIPDSRERTLHH